MSDLSLCDHLFMSSDDREIDLSTMDCELDSYRDAVEEAVWTINNEMGFTGVSESDHEDWDEYETAKMFWDEAAAYGDVALSEEAFRENAMERIKEEWGHKDIPWHMNPFCHIDWDAVLNDAESDATQVEWNGRTFYVI